MLRRPRCGERVVRLGEGVHCVRNRRRLRRFRRLLGRVKRLLRGVKRVSRLVTLRVRGVEPLGRLVELALRALLVRLCGNLRVGRVVRLALRRVQCLAVGVSSVLRRIGRVVRLLGVFLRDGTGVLVGLGVRLLCLVGVRLGVRHVRVCRVLLALRLRCPLLGVPGRCGIRLCGVARALLGVIDCLLGGTAGIANSLIGVIDACPCRIRRSVCRVLLLPCRRDVRDVRVCRRLCLLVLLLRLCRLLSEVVIGDRHVLGRRLRLCRRAGPLLGQRRLRRHDATHRSNRRDCDSERCLRLSTHVSPWSDVLACFRRAPSGRYLALVILSAFGKPFALMHDCISLPVTILSVE